MDSAKKPPSERNFKRKNLSTFYIYIYIERERERKQKPFLIKKKTKQKKKLGFRNSTIECFGFSIYIFM